MPSLKLYSPPAAFTVDGRRLEQMTCGEVEIDIEHTRVRIDSAIPRDGVEWSAKVGEKFEIGVLFERQILTVRARVAAVGIGVDCTTGSYQIVRLVGPRTDWTPA